MYEYKARVLSVYDGDTATLLIDIGFKVFLKERVRFYGIDTPEIRTRDKEEKKKGLMVRDFVRDMIDKKEIRVQTSKEGKYGRYLATIFIGDVNLNDLLVEKGYAKSYFGGTR